MAAAQRLAVEGGDFLGNVAAQALGPGTETLGKLARVERGEDASKGVRAGDGIGQLQKGAQPRLFGPAEVRKIHEALRATEHGEQGDEEDVFEQMRLGAIHAWIDNDQEVFFQADGMRWKCHRKLVSTLVRKVQL